MACWLWQVKVMLGVVGLAGQRHDLAGGRGLERVLDQVADHAGQQRLVADEGAPDGSRRDPQGLVARYIVIAEGLDHGVEERPRLQRRPLHGQGVALGGHQDALALDLLHQRVRGFSQVILDLVEGDIAGRQHASHGADAAGRVQDVVEEHALEDLTALLVRDVVGDEQHILLVAPLEGGGRDPEVEGFGTEVRLAVDAAFLVRALAGGRVEDRLHGAAGAAGLGSAAAGSRLERRPAREQFTRAHSEHGCAVQRCGQRHRGAVAVDDLALPVQDQDLLRQGVEDRHQDRRGHDRAVRGGDRLRVRALGGGVLRGHGTVGHGDVSRS
ncbi:MAG: hypothetical protein IPH86_07855 [bacterium]|nr:hypothetical protein [bacterium]